jgi:hypothetical protein
MYLFNKARAKTSAAFLSRQHRNAVSGTGAERPGFGAAVVRLEAAAPV